MEGKNIMKEKSKKGQLLAILYAILSILLIFGPKSIFAVCKVEEKPMKCYWSTQAVLAMALILLAIAILLFAAKSVETKLALSLLGIVSAVMIILIPANVIGGCSKKTMACQSLTFPAFYLIAGLIIISSIAEVFLLQREKVKTGKQEWKDENR